jgi:hypothetical protein
MFRFQLLLLILFVIVAFSGCSSSSILTPTPAPTLTVKATEGTPIPTPTGRASLTPGGAGTIKATVTSFYQAIESQKYIVANSYLDANATTTNGQRLSQQTFTQLAQSRDNQFGPVTGFDLLLNSSDPSQVIMTIARKNGFRYHAHLQVKQEGNNWKILTLDRI